MLTRTERTRQWLTISLADLGYYILECLAQLLRFLSWAVALGSSILLFLATGFAFTVASSGFRGEWMTGLTAAMVSIAAIGTINLGHQELAKFLERELENPWVKRVIMAFCLGSALVPSLLIEYEWVKL